MQIYKNKYQAYKNRKKGEEKVVKVCGGYMVIGYLEYNIWKKQK